MSDIPSLLRFRADPHELFEEIRTTGPRFDPDIGGWVFVSHADVSAVLRRPQFGRAPTGVAPTTSTYSFLGVDPPDHTRLRAIVSEPFQATNAERLRDDIATRARGLVDRALRAASFDVVIDIAAPLAAATSCNMLGVASTDTEAVRAWASALTWLFEPRPDPAIRARADDAARDASAYFSDALKRPSKRGLVNTLSSAIADGECSIDEATAMCLLFIMAGHETTVGLIGLATAAILDAPQQAAGLRTAASPLDRAVDELVRYTSPVQMLTRLAKEDVHWGDVHVESGSFAIAVVAAANRDPDVFEKPNELRLDRGNAARHVGFGAGIHHCLGAALARLQADAFLHAIAQNLPRLVATEGAAFSEKALFRSLSHLPVEVRQS